MKKLKKIRLKKKKKTGYEEEDEWDLFMPCSSNSDNLGCGSWSEAFAVAGF